MEDWLRRITELDRQFSGRLGVYVKDLKTGAELAYQADVPCETASTVKVPILVELFRQIEAGRHDLDQLVAVEECHRTTGSGVIRDLAPGLRLRLHDLATLMIIVSDNIATNVLIDLVGLDHVNRTMADLGLRVTRLYKKIDWTIPGPLGQSTPRELGWLAEKLYRGELVSPQASQQMLAILLKQHYTNGTTRLLPYELLAAEESEPRVRVATKSGSMEGVRNDYGIIFTPWGDFVLAMMTQACQDLRFHVDNEAMLILPQVARATYDHLTAAWAQGQQAAGG